MPATRSDSLSPHIDRKMPEEFGQYINQENYNLIVEIIIGYFEKSRERILSLEDAFLHVADGEGRFECDYSLINLVRILASLDKSQWKEHIREFFDNSAINFPAYDFFFKDYEHARAHLKILVKPDNFEPESMKGQSVVRTDFPGTVSALVFHYDSKFRFLTKDDIAEWGVSVEELFTEAMANIYEEKLLIEGKELEGGMKMYVILSNESSAACMAAVEKRLPYLVGEGGTIFSIPSNGTAFAMPLNEGMGVKKALYKILAVTTHAFRKEPGPITWDIFHYQDGKVSSMLDTLKDTYPRLYKQFARFISTLG